MLRFYLDDSGTDAEAPIVTMGGYLTSVEGWERFETLANPILDAEGIGCLHAVDFHHGRGDFKNWDGVRKGSLVTRLYNAMAEVKAIGITFSALKQTYNDRRAELHVNHQISAYGFCFGGIINALARKDLGRGALKEHGCAILIEGGNQHDGDLTRAFAGLSKKYEIFRQMFPEFGFVSKQSCRAIQMADFLAYHDRRQIMGAERKGSHPDLPPDAPAMIIAKQLVKHGQIVATDFYGKTKDAKSFVARCNQD